MWNHPAFPSRPRMHPTPRAGAVGRSSDSWTPTYLSPLPDPAVTRTAASVPDGDVRFHSPLRGSSGFPPDSLLARPPARMAADANRQRRGR